MLLLRLSAYSLIVNVSESDQVVPRGVDSCLRTNGERSVGSVSSGGCVGYAWQQVLSGGDGNRDQQEENNLKHGHYVRAKHRTRSVNHDSTEKVLTDLIILEINAATLVTASN